MLVLCSQHNPVGRVWSREELTRLSEICDQNDLLIVSDELHSDLTYSWASSTAFGTLDARFNDRLIVYYRSEQSVQFTRLKDRTDYHSQSDVTRTVCQRVKQLE